MEIFPALCESILSMAPGERSDDDEMELINAEFESMVADLNLDQSTPRTYLDDLDDLAEHEKYEQKAMYLPPRNRRGLHGSIQYLKKSIKRWWNKPPSDDSDGAVV